jgi:hypothetical protein
LDFLSRFFFFLGACFLIPKEQGKRSVCKRISKCSSSVSRWNWMEEGVGNKTEWIRPIKEAMVREGEKKDLKQTGRDEISLSFSSSLIVLSLWLFITISLSVGSPQG